MILQTGICCPLFVRASVQCAIVDIKNTKLIKKTINLAYFLVHLGLSRGKMPRFVCFIEGYLETFPAQIHKERKKKIRK